MTNDEALIRTLVADLAPVRRLAGITRRTWLWCAAAFSCVAVAAHLLGVRHDLFEKLRAPAFRVEVVALSAVCVLSAWNAFRSSIPGSQPGPMLRFAPFLALSVWLMAMIGGRSTSDAAPAIVLWGFSRSGLLCVARTCLFALGPAVFSWLMLRRGAALERSWTTLFAVLSAMSLALVATRSVCSKDGLDHQLVWHAVPLLLALVLPPRRIDRPLACSSAPWHPRANSKYEEY